MDDETSADCVTLWTLRILAGFIIAVVLFITALVAIGCF